MLKPDCIPDTEPEIRAGIVLPEDAKQSLTVFLPGQRCILTADYGNIEFCLSGITEIHFRLSGEQIELVFNDTEPVSAAVWSLKFEKCKKDIDPEQTFLVKNIEAGRGFHWQKNIDVDLPGALELRISERALVLLNILPFETYIACVAASEMGSECPKALIESQTIAARSWMLANVEQKHMPMGFDVCNDDCCQRYQGTTYLGPQALRCAENTYGLVLMSNDRICDARYSKSCGGMTESFDAVWKGKFVSYLPVKPDWPEGSESNLPNLSDEKTARNWIESVPNAFCSPYYVPENQLYRYLGFVDEASSYYRWCFIYTQKEITELLNNKKGIDAEKILGIFPVKRGGSGRIICLIVRYMKKISSEIYSLEISDQYEIRRVFHSGFLYSSAFIVDSQGGEIPDQFVFKGAGWGHGAGYCQIGALGMALAGYTKEDILSHYFPGSVLKKLY